jgi:pectin methylesterase-like acyl-CoA thioesterase
MRKKSLMSICVIAVLMVSALAFKNYTDSWQSKLVTLNADGSLTYHPDVEGNTLPDFSRVGYHEGDKPIPDVAVVKTVEAPADGNGQQLIQDAINEVAKLRPNAEGFRGAILLKKGIYKVADSLRISTSGIVLRGEGSDKNGTIIIATGKGQRSLLHVAGRGNIREADEKVKIVDDFVPVGVKSFSVQNPTGFKPGDRIIVYRPSPANWIHDLKMDQIFAKADTKQWKAGEYDLRFERTITKIEGNEVFIDNSIVMQMSSKYGGGTICKYSFPTRIKEVGVENILFESEYTSNTDEDHGWNAIVVKDVENGWVRNVAAKYFGNSCVTLQGGTRNFTVTDSKCTEAKSVIDGGRRYSFDNNGQLNLFMNCHTEDGRHDYVTSARVCGPNVFYNSSSTKTHADAGPHHRWTSGTLYDNITTDGEINVQDRGSMGTGHGWSGVTQVLWNCKAARAAVQNPWVSGQNYCIGLTGERFAGALAGRYGGFWEGQNKKGLEPASLYMAQFKARHLNDK